MTTTHAASTMVQVHACVVEGTTYRFGVRWAAAEELTEPALARVLLDVHVSAGDQFDNRPFARLSVVVPLGQPAQIPRLLTAALRDCLRSRQQTG